MAFTLIPCAAKSAAISRVSAASAALEVAQTEPAKGCTREPAIELTLTTLPEAASSSPARKHYRREEIHLKHRLPGAEPRLDGAESRGTRALRRDCRIVDERVQPGALRLEPVLHLGNGAKRAIGIAEVDLDVIPRSRLPRTILRESVA